MNSGVDKVVSGDLGIAPEQVLVAGDWHGNVRFAVQILKQAHADGITHVLHVGDFGIWPGLDGVKFLRALDRQLAVYGQTLWFLDGNHDDHDQIDALPIDPATGVRRFADRIFHLPRGFRWTWAGKTWMALGGATSLDRRRRTPGKTWWPQEEITEQDISAATTGGFVDIMLTHDCPAGVAIPGLLDGWDPHELLRAHAHQQLLARVVHAVRPALLIHGHFHVRYEDRLDYHLEDQLDGPDRPSCTVQGLGDDGGSIVDNVIIVTPEEAGPERPGVRPPRMRPDSRHG